MVFVLLNVPNNLPNIHEFHECYGGILMAANDSIWFSPTFQTVKTV